MSKTEKVEKFIKTEKGKALLKEVNKDKTPKVTRSFRVDKEILRRLWDEGMDPNRIVEAALAKAVALKKCPYCGK